MRQVVQLRGEAAQIRWSYHVAAALRSYTVQADKATKTWRLRATVETCDAFKLAQAPLELVAPYQGGVWRWAIVAHHIVNGTVTATLSLIKE